MNRHRFAVSCFATLSLVVTSGLARASATVDLIWADTGTDLLSLTSANTSSTYTLNIILTAGAGGSAGAGVSVNYGDALPTQLRMLCHLLRERVLERVLELWV